MFHTNEHLTPASAHKTVQCGPGLSGATSMCSVCPDARLKFKQMQPFYVHADIFSVTFFFFLSVKQELLGEHSSVLLTLGIPNPVK